MKVEGSVKTLKEIALESWSQEQQKRKQSEHKRRKRLARKIESAIDDLLPKEADDYRFERQTEDPRYGGCGTTGMDLQGNWRIPGRAAVVLTPGPETRPRSGGRPLEKVVRERNVKALENRGERP